MSVNREHNRRLLLIATAVIAVIIALAVWQRDNIRAFCLSLRYDDKELEYQLERIEEELTGELDEMKEELKTQAVLSSKSSQSMHEEDSSKLARADEIVSEIYALRDSYSERLDELKAQASDEYYSLPDEGKTSEEKKRIALSYIDDGTALERECDEKIEALLSELKSLLDALGKDTDIVNDAAYAYAQAKQTKKAQLLSSLNN